MEENNNSNWLPTKKFFPEAILIALLTGVGYLAAFTYQYSYLEYFNIPIFFVDINLSLILLVSLVGLIFLIGLGMVINFYIVWNPRTIFLRIIKQLSISTALLVGLFPPIFATMQEFWPILVIMSVALIGLIVVSIQLYRDPRLMDKTETKRNKNDLLFKAEQLYGSFPILFVVILVLFVFYSSIMGTVIAKTKSEYLVSNTDPNLIIISTYSDSFIGLTFDSSAQKFNKDVTILSKDKISEDKIIFTSQKLGHLKSN